MNLTYRFLGGQAGWLFSAQECGFHGTMSPWAANKQWLSCIAAIFSEAAGKVCKLSCSIPTHTCTNTHILCYKMILSFYIVTKFSSCDFFKLTSFSVFGPAAVVFLPLVSLWVIFGNPHLSSVLLLIHPGMWTALGAALPNCLIHWIVFSM